MRKVDRYSNGTDECDRISELLWIDEACESRMWKCNLKAQKLDWHVHHRQAPLFSAGMSQFADRGPFLKH